MQRIVLKFGLVSGAIVSTFLVLMLVLTEVCRVDLDYSQIFGYASMILAFLLVFFGIRSYRDDVGGGAISFGRAVTVGLLITLVASAVYVLVWEITFFAFLPDFADRFADMTLARMRESGESATAIAAAEARMARFAELYDNPFFNSAITFLEIFPVGLVVTLVSAAILRRREGAGTPAAVTA